MKAEDLPFNFTFENFLNPLIGVVFDCDTLKHLQGGFLEEPIIQSLKLRNKNFSEQFKTCPPSSAKNVDRQKWPNKLFKDTTQSRSVT